MSKPTQLLLALAVLTMAVSGCDQSDQAQDDGARKEAATQDQPAQEPQAGGERKQDDQAGAERDREEQNREEQESKEQTSGEHAPYAVDTHYRVLEEPVEVDNPDKIEVREFFFYGCPHCYDAEPIVNDWLQDKPDDVNYVRTPVLFLKNSEPLARAFYVAKNQDILDEVHEPMFDKIHKHREPLFSVPALANFFRNYGIEPDRFNDLYSSFGVSTKVKQAESLAREYQIRGVPAFAVDGEYVVLRKNLSNDQETFEVIDYLIDKAREDGN